MCKDVKAYLNYPICFVIINFINGFFHERGSLSNTTHWMAVRPANISPAINIRAFYECISRVVSRSLINLYFANNFTTNSIRRNYMYINLQIHVHALSLNNTAVQYKVSLIHELHLHCSLVLTCFQSQGSDTSGSSIFNNTKVYVASRVRIRKRADREWWVKRKCWHGQIQWRYLLALFIR